MIELRILGALEAVDEDGPVALGSPQQRALLAVLLLHRGQPVSSDRLIDALWGEQPPPSAIKIVQGYVSNGRHEVAATLRGAARALGYPPPGFDRRIDDRLERDYLAAARTRYGDTAWRDAKQAGAALSLQQAIAYALAHASDPATRPADAPDTVALAPGPDSDT